MILFLNISIQNGISNDGIGAIYFGPKTIRILLRTA